MGKKGQCGGGKGGGVVQFKWRKRRVRGQGEFLVFLGCTHARKRATVYCKNMSWSPEKIETKNYAQLASGTQKQFCLAKVIAESLQRQWRRRGQNLTPPAENPPVPSFPNPRDQRTRLELPKKREEGGKSIFTTRRPSISGRMVGTGVGRRGGEGH